MAPLRMRALVFDAPADDETHTQVRVVPTPRPGAGEVLLRVAYAGLNFKDVMARRGDRGYVDAWPFVPGLEAAGTVVATGPEVASVGVGDRVAALTNAGALAEYVLARAELTAAVPTGLSTASAAVAPGALTTAALLVDHVARVRRDDVIVVHSAAGAVGSAVAAIARTHPGVRLIGTVGSETRIEAAQGGGYDLVLVRGLNLVEQVTAHVGARGVDVVLDPQGTRGLEADLALLSPGGRIVVFGNAGGNDLEDPPPVGQLMSQNASLGGFSLASLSTQRPRLVAETIGSIQHRLADGTLRLDLTELDGLQAVPAAHQALADGRGATKYVARLTPPE